MGQKSNPNGMRIGINKDWKSNWFPHDKENWTKWIIQDDKIRKFIDKHEKEWAIGDILIERQNNEVKIIIKTAKTGSILGQNGENVKKLQKDIQRLIKDRKLKYTIEVEQIQKPDLDAKIIANEIAEALENRGSFRIVQKRVIRRVLKSGAQGIKTQVSGRLNGADMARHEGYSFGVVPLQTLRNDVDFAVAHATTKYGQLGVKVWISRGEVLTTNNTTNVTDEKQFNKPNTNDKDLSKQDEKSEKEVNK